jgi:hypothetical protein
MASNQILKELHNERLKRQNPDVHNTDKKVDKAVSKEEPFSCAVCYTDGSSSGIVSPACCRHKICLDCYTKITLLNKEKASCPECRTLYIKKAKEEIDEYADMPPLISAQQLIANYLLENELIHFINTINYAYDQLN